MVYKVKYLSNIIISNDAFAVKKFGKVKFLIKLNKLIG